MPPSKITRAGAAALLLLGACASQPLGPTVAVMPAPNKPFSVFQDDQVICRNYADQQVAGGAQQATSQQLSTAVIGTAFGAGIGAAAGGGKGAAVGASAGALGGAVVGAAPAEQAQRTLQQRYDIAYTQCMYARGNQVPGFGAPPPPPVR
jgi:uncharacterized protein YcfJ